MIPFIDPVVRFWLGVLFSVAGAIAGGSIVLHGAFPDAWLPFIIAWGSIISAVGNIVLTALNAAATTTSSRAMAAAADPSVQRVVMTTVKGAKDIPSDKVVGK